jgi:hypothetical protein
MTVALGFSCAAQPPVTDDECGRAIWRPIVMLGQPVPRDVIDAAVTLALQSSQYAKEPSGRYVSQARECYIAPRWERDDRLIVEIYVKDLSLDDLDALTTTPRERIAGEVA